MGVNLRIKSLTKSLGEDNLISLRNAGMQEFKNLRMRHSSVFNTEKAVETTDIADHTDFQRFRKNRGSFS